ncbi:MAG: M20 family metallopeptidase [Promethearchaeota archaeon]
MENLEKIVLDKIDSMKNEIIEFQQKIIQIPSENPPSKYKPISKFTEKKMKEIGLKTQIKRNNVIGELGNGNGKELILYGHLDTVEVAKGWSKDPFGGEIVDNKIYGRGASDDKSCVTAEIFATKALLDAGVNINGKLIVTAVVDEETGGFRGADYLLENELIKGDACLLGDAPANQPIGYCGGGMFITFIINGKRSHGMGAPDVPSPYRNEHSGINAIQKMLKIMNFLTELKVELNNKETKYPMPPGFPSKVSDINLAEIHGGTKISIVPGKCLFHCSINTIPEQDIESIKKRILNHVEDLKKEDPDLDIIVQIPIAYEPQVIDKDSEFAKIIKNATKVVFNEEKEFKLFIPTTDAHWFQERGIETILIGTIGGDNNAHAEDEFVYIDDLINTTKMYAITALNYLK